jgi:precorrin-2/cobalt-factor-2 C20-methyltransferase
MNHPAKFYGIGVGPGDPELLTLKAARLLREVDWLFLPAGSSSRGGFARTIVESLSLDPARFRQISLCMSRQRDAALDRYEKAAEEILAELRLGKSAAWITEGDPLLYSTFLHVFTALRRRDPQLSVDIVPGITSVQAAAALAQTPIARLDESVAIIPAAYGLDRLGPLLDEFATIFLLKVYRTFDPLLDELAKLDRPVQTYYLERVGTAQQRIVTDLTTLRGAELPYWGLVILRRESEERS